jgi:hypothetical protein
MYENKYINFHTTFSSSVILSMMFAVRKIHTETMQKLKQKDTLTCSELLRNYNTILGFKLRIKTVLEQMCLGEK